MGDNGPKKWGIRKKIIWIAASLLFFIILIGLGIFGYHKLSVIIKQSQLRAAYEESLTLIPEEVPIPEEVHITEWNLARIIIPKIGVDLIVLGGVDIYDPINLKQGPVHFGETLARESDYKGSLPNTVSGNVAIAGHRAGNQRFFYDIDLLETRDEIALDINGYRFIYHVQWQKVTDKFDWSCLEPTDYPALTLQTNEPKDHKGPDSDYRLFIRAKLHEVKRAPVGKGYNKADESSLSDKAKVVISEGDFSPKIGTLPYRGAVLFIGYEGEADLAGYEIYVNITSNRKIMQENTPVEEADGDFVATIVDLMYLPGDKLDFVIIVNDGFGEELELYHSEVLERYPWKDWMLSLNEWVSLDAPPQYVRQNFDYNWHPRRGPVYYHSSWDIWTTQGKDVEVYCGTAGVVYSISPDGVEDGYVYIYNPYVGALLHYGHTSPAEGIFVGKNVLPGEHIANIDPKQRHIHYNTIRPFRHTRWSDNYRPVISMEGKHILGSEYYKDPFYFHEPTTLGYWYEETLPKGLKDEMLRMFKRDNPGVVLPATEPLEPLD